MPRSTQSPAGRILTFFRSAEMSNAVLVLGLASDIVKERQGKSQEAKDRAAAAQRAASRAQAGHAATPTTHERHVAAGKKAAATRKRKSRSKKLPSSSYAGSVNSGLDGLGETP